MVVVEANHSDAEKVFPGATIADSDGVFVCQEGGDAPADEYNLIEEFLQRVSDARDWG